MGISTGWRHVKIEQSAKFEHLAALLRREWFNRTWVVQEVASAQKAVLMCGNEFIPWELVSDVFIRLHDPLFTLSYISEAKTRHAHEKILAMESARRSVNGTFSLSLFEILLATCLDDCSDPRDKIFAVLGLAKDWLEKGGLAPDYRRSTTAQDIFRRFAMWDVKKNGKIRILSCAGGCKESSDLPSWAPDWRNIQNANPFVRYSERTMFSASQNTKVDAWHSDHGQALNTIGEIVDAINTLGSEPRYHRIIDNLSTHEGRLDELKKTHAWLQECQHFAANRSSSGMTPQRYDDFCRTMTCGLTADAFPAPPEFGEYLMKYLDFMNHEVPKVMAAAEEIRKKDPTHVVACLGDDHPDIEIHALIESSIEKWASKRRFCTTSKGRLAFVPPIAQAGDLICILYGGEVPYVLRPQGSESYVVVGECYVSGIMHGEALSGETFRTRRFRIV